MSNPSHPPSALLVPSRPTTATTSSDAQPASTSRLPVPPRLPSPPPNPPGPITVHPQFTKQAPIRPLAGTVRIRVQRTTFYASADILQLASPFFEAVLQGGWRETAGPSGKKLRRRSKMSMDGSGVQETILEEEERISVDLGNGGATLAAGLAGLGVAPLPDEPHAEDNLEQQLETLVLPPSSPPASEAGGFTPSIAPSYLSSVDYDEEEDQDDDDESIVCRIALKEETASSFQDLLCHIYPRLECLVTWQNAGDLLTLASKFDVPSLRNACIAFLLPSCAGNPIEGMRIAEDSNISELYKESSRYALDNYHNYSPEELAVLTPQTLIKLERKRSWFLERLLKLGLVQTSRDYVCAPTCPDSTSCANLVAAKWSSAWTSSFRFGTPQPSIIYRSLRSLEPSLSSPALHLTQTACQNHAKLYVADLFDRMFSISIAPSRSWSALTSTGLSSSGGFGRTFGPGADALGKNSARYFLYVDLDGNTTARPRTSPLPNST